MAQMPLDVFGERRHGLVALCRVTLECLRNNRVQIAPARTPQPLAGRTTLREDAHRVRVIVIEARHESLGRGGSRSIIALSSSAWAAPACGMVG